MLEETETGWLRLGLPPFAELGAFSRKSATWVAVVGLETATGWLRLGLPPSQSSGGSDRPTPNVGCGGLGDSDRVASFGFTPFAELGGLRPANAKLLALAVSVFAVLLAWGCPARVVNRQALKAKSPLV